MFGLTRKIQCVDATRALGSAVGAANTILLPHPWPTSHRPHGARGRGGGEGPCSTHQRSMTVLLASLRAIPMSLGLMCTTSSDNCHRCATHFTKYNYKIMAAISTFSKKQFALMKESPRSSRRSHN